MSLEGRPVGTGKRHVHKVVPRVQIPERGSHIDCEVVPLQAVLLSSTHFKEDADSGLCAKALLTQLRPKLKGARSLTLSDLLTISLKTSVRATWTVDFQHIVANKKLSLET